MDKQMGSPAEAAVTVLHNEGVAPLQRWLLTGFLCNTCVCANNKMPPDAPGRTDKLNCSDEDEAEMQALLLRYYCDLQLDEIEVIDTAHHVRIYYILPFSDASQAMLGQDHNSDLPDLHNIEMLLQNFRHAFHLMS
eukprot:g5020.t1